MFSMSKIFAAFTVALAIILLGANSAQAVLNSNTPVNVSGGSSLIFSPTGDKVYSTNYSAKTVSVIDASTQTLLRTSAALPNTILGIAVSPDGLTLYVLTAYVATVNQVLVLDEATLTVQSTIDVGPNTADIVISPDGQTLYVTNYKRVGQVTANDNSVSVIDIATQNVSYLRTGTSDGQGGTYAFDQPGNLAISHDGAYIYVANRAANTIVKIRTSDNKIMWTTASGLVQLPYGIEISADGNAIFVGSDDLASATTSFIETINAVDGTQLARTSTPAGTAPNGSNGLYDISINGDGSMLYVAAAGTSGGFLEYSVASNTLTFLNNYTTTGVLRVEASPADSTFYGGVSASVIPYGPALGRASQEIAKVTGDSVTSLGFTPTGLSGSVTYSISPGLPAGLSFNTSTGVISGTPTSALSRTIFTIKASNGSSTAAAFVAITVTSAPSGGTSNPSSPALANTGMNYSMFLASSGLGLSLIILGGVMVYARRLQSKQNS